MNRQHRRLKPWVLVLLGICALVAAMAFVPTTLSRGGMKATWRLVPDYRVKASSSRVVSYDEPFPYRPGDPPGIVYQVHREQFGLLVLERSRPVPPRPGDYTV